MKKSVKPQLSKQKLIYLKIYHTFFQPALPFIRSLYFLIFPLRLFFIAFNKIYFLIINEHIKTKMVSCGKGVHLNGSISIQRPENLTVGNNVHINNNAKINCYGPVSIGDHTHISHNFTLYSGNHNYMGKRLPYDETLILKPVTIGRNVWIGINVSVIPGVTIGDGAIIGMGTTVSSDVPPLAIVGNGPARIIKYRNKSEYEELEQKKQFGGMAGFEYIDE